MQQKQVYREGKEVKKFSWLWLIFWTYLDPGFGIIYLFIKFLDWIYCINPRNERRVKN